MAPARRPCGAGAGAAGGPPVQHRTAWARLFSSSPTKKARAARRRGELQGARRGGAAEQVDDVPLGKFACVLLGRPNVGKSTLFNRLALRRTAIVDRVPGTTRDWKEGDGFLGGLEFALYDTGGLEDIHQTGQEMSNAMLKHAARAVQYADVVLFLIDGREGVTEDDAHFALWLKKVCPGVTVVPVINKCETLLSGVGGNEEWEAMRAECFRLGFGEPVATSAEHGDGLSGLYDALRPFAEAAGAAAANESAEEDLEAAAIAAESSEAGHSALTPATAHRTRLELAVVGRPNVGKSTLINQLLQEERVLTGPTPGVTRDSTRVQWTYRGQEVALVDTAGIRRWSTRERDNALEAVSVGHARRALAMANVVVLLCDATEGLTKWDLGLAQEIIDEGRALVVALNKIDAVENELAVAAWVRQRVADVVNDARGVEVVVMSALDGDGVEQLMPVVLRAWERWNRRISTGKLNRWFERLSRHSPPPAASKTVVVRGSGRDRSRATKSLPLKVKYLTQINVRPPTFALFANRPEVPEPYKRFLVNALRNEFELDGVPIRLLVRASNNPYTKRKSGGLAGAAGKRGVLTAEDRRRRGESRVSRAKRVR